MVAVAARPGRLQHSPSASASATDDVAWVATGASVTLPGTGVTPVNLARRHVESRRSPWAACPRRWPTRPAARTCSSSRQGDDQLHEIDTATHGVVHEVGVGVEPDAVAVAPGGTGGKGVALVANLDSTP